MPILQVEVVLAEGDELRSDWARALADAAGEALGAEPGTCWVRLRGLAREHYAENGGAPTDLLPVFVDVLLADLPAAKERGPLVERLTAALAAALDRPAGSVHVLLAPPAAGRIAFGGRLRS